MPERWFSDEELDEMTRPTMDVTIDAIDSGDLKTATDYVLTLQNAGAERGLVAFIALPVQLAHATLDRVEMVGPGSKLSRPEVYAILNRLHRALDRNEPAVTDPSEPIPAVWR